MKSSRGITLGILCLFLFVMIFTVISESNISYLTNSSANVVKVKEAEEKEKLDISDVAYGLDDRIDGAAISSIATNIERVEVYRGMTIEELGVKLNKSLKGVLANKGDYIARKSLAVNVDPYMAVAIMLHETGCNATCSRLATVNYNVGGMRGRSGWQKFSSIEAGIDGFLNNLSKNYVKKGLTTPETIVKKYAPGSTSWAGKIRSYMNTISAK